MPVCAIGETLIQFPYIMIQLSNAPQDVCCRAKNRTGLSWVLVQCHKHYRMSFLLQISLFHGPFCAPNEADEDYVIMYGQSLT